MSKTTKVTLIVLALAGLGLYVFLADPLSLQPDRGTVEELSETFMEDLQFKDFRQAGLYHHKLERDRLDIGKALEALFLVKPELLDIKDFDIVKADIDSNGTRARTLVRTRYSRLNYDKEPQEKDLMLYWIKRHPDCRLGGGCEAGVCVDEFGAPQLAIVDEDKRRGDRKELEDNPEAEASGAPLMCDPEASHRWFMNLDSTLKRKNYK